jgi:hypothetical protein
MSQTERREEPRNQNTNREKRGTKKPEYKQREERNQETRIQTERREEPRNQNTNREERNQETRIQTERREEPRNQNTNRRMTSSVSQ